MELVLLVRVGYREGLYFQVLWVLLGDSVASQSHYSLPTVTGLTGLSGSEAGFGLRQSPVDKRSSSQIVDNGEAFDSEDVFLAILVQQERNGKAKGQKKHIDARKLSRDGRPNPIPRSGSDEEGRVFSEDMLQEFHGPNRLQRDLKIHCSTDT